jgi:dienelactone hydrolase
MQTVSSGENLTEDKTVTIPVGDVVLKGNLRIPAGATGLVIFAHGSGSSRHSPRNRHVAQYLNSRGIGTLLIDLLSSQEEAIDIRTRHLRFDVDMLADRLAAIVRWVAVQAELGGLTIGYFGSSTGSGAALLATARQPDRIAAIVSRGGRPDLAGEALARITVPVRLIVGRNDAQVLALNEQSLRLLNERSKLDVVPGATHLFEEPGTLDKVCELAAEWFSVHLR